MNPTDEEYETSEMKAQMEQDFQETGIEQLIEDLRTGVTTEVDPDVRKLAQARCAERYADVRNRLLSNQSVVDKELVHLQEDVRLVQERLAEARKNHRLTPVLEAQEKLRRELEGVLAILYHDGDKKTVNTSHGDVGHSVKKGIKITDHTQFAEDLVKRRLFNNLGAEVKVSASKARSFAEGPDKLSGIEVDDTIGISYKAPKGSE